MRAIDGFQTILSHLTKFRRFILIQFFGKNQDEPRQDYVCAIRKAFKMIQ